MTRWWLELASLNKEKLRVFLVMSEGSCLGNLLFFCKNQSKLDVYWTLVGIITACH